MKTNAVAPNEDTQPGVTNLSGVFWASLKKPNSQDAGPWFFLIVFVLITLAGLGEAIFDWFDFGTIGRIVSAIVAIVAGLFAWIFTGVLGLRPGLSGRGIRIIDDGRIEIISFAPGENGASNPLQSIVLKSGDRQYAGSDLAILVNVLRTYHGNWTIGHLVLTHVDGRSLLKLQYVTAFVTPNSANATADNLYISENGQMQQLATCGIVVGLTKLSSILKRSGAQLRLTFTEFASGTAGTAQTFGAVGQLAISARSKHLQSDANSKLKCGQLPVEANLSDGLMAIVREFNYHLIENEFFAPVGFCSDVKSAES